ncbi:ABC transporter ATP-binding protein [Rubrivirga sp. S365]|uniref:ABC transporter ATP-binding protein n=1 Tax=Rubrivirga litoralis TaxID=3075598 RepID=A0ABU3BPH3_9BACT|nr:MULTISPECIES: ABC transporter ATP-binding protein [unclassified Rubrivirga]MDT0631182.1 ABC transporter ATP-binding protein [Rubrivirga sp. F394]MDT7856675.1 ABC transporter ATP-binding protein [Rubrivirga sp. S365]
MPHLAAHDLSVSLGDRSVLRDVSFAVAEGERVGLVGPNGAGKTTLLRAAAGLLPYSGTLALRGRGVRAWPARERAREVALVRQQADLAVDFTVAEVVGLGRAPHLGWLAALGGDDQRRVAKALAAVDLAAFADRPVPELSGGEQQRVFLAQALAQDARLLLLDEPTAHLDVRHQLDLLARVRALGAAGRTVVAAVHDLELAARFADRLWVLAGGRLVADGPPADVLRPALLRDVFGVEAEVDTDAAGVRIRYFGALGSGT